MKSAAMAQVEQSAVCFIQNYCIQESLETQIQGDMLIQKLKRLKKESFTLPLNLQTATITQRTLETALDDYGLRMSLYYMPKGTLMGLHNHPKMIVLSYIIQGQIKATFYTPQKAPKIYKKEQALLQTGSLSFIDGILTQQRNLHELYAEQSTFFLDIVFPDYDDMQRDCLCFKEVKQISENIFELQQTPCTLMLLPL